VGKTPSEDDSTVLVLLVETAPSYWTSVSTTADSERDEGGLLDLKSFIEQVSAAHSMLFLCSFRNAFSPCYMNVPC
jgi:hypothetical protein